MSHRFLVVSSLAVLSSGLAVGCTSEADDLTLEGVDALEACDIRGAHEKFAAAHDDDPDHPQAALGFALTDFALLPESGEGQALLESIGFTGPIDMQAAFFGPEGALARSARGDTCESIEEHLRAEVPYAPMTSDVAPEDVLPASTHGQELVERARAIAPRLRAQAEALETAAAGMLEPVTIAGGCGVDSVVLQPPELYFAAGMLRLFAGGIEATSAYDFDFSREEMAMMMRDRDMDAAAITQVLNDHVLRLMHGDRVQASRGDLEAALRDFDRGATAALRIDSRISPEVLFDWSLAGDDRLTDIQTITRALAGSLEERTELPLFTPRVQLDLGPVFEDPPSHEDLASPLFVTEEFTDYTSVKIDIAALRPWLDRHTTPSIFDESVSEGLQFEAEARWDEERPSFFDPSQRFSRAWQCMDTTDTSP